jgi:hypothetical protein
VRTDLAGEGQLVRADVERDHVRRGELAQQLDRDVPQPARADHYGRRPGDESVQYGADRVVRGERRIGQRGCADRIEVPDRHEVPRTVDDHVLGHRTGMAQAAPALSLQAQLLRPVRAHDAHAAAPRAVHDHG